jgi:hypothetical protein
LCCPHRPRGGQRAADQDHGVERTEVLVEEKVAEDEDLGVVGAVDRVGDEEPTEEQDLGRQKDPHPELGRLVLLVGIFEVVIDRQAFTLSVFGPRHQPAPCPDASTEDGSLRT